MERHLRGGAVRMIAAMLISGSIGALVLVSGRAVEEVVFWRCLFGALVLLPVCVAMGWLRGEWMSRRVLALSAFAGLLIVGNWLALFASYSRASIGVATALYNTQPLMLIALGALLFKERPRPARLGWLLLAFAGTVLLAEGHGEVAYAEGSYASGIALALVAALLYAGAALVVKRLDGVPPGLITLVQLGVGVMLLAPFAGIDALPAFTFTTWWCLVLLGVVHTGFMYVLLYGAIQKLPTVLVGVLSFVYPLSAIGMDWLVFGQRLTLVQGAGVVMVLVSAAMVGLLRDRMAVRPALGLADSATEARGDELSARACQAGTSRE